jgi:predicted nucleotide-binding protein
VDSSSPQENIILSVLLKHLEKAKSILAKGSVKRGQVQVWSTLVKNQIQKIYGAEHVISESLSPKLIPEGVDFDDELRKRMALLERYVLSLERSGSNIFLGKNEGSKIFIGHGRSPMWRELKDFLNDRLSLPWDEFNREAVAGIHTFDRISEMLDSACFAFLIMTAEDQYSDSSIHARQNVVHEIGLFQGRLGPRKAIILMEDGCSEFSNIVGLSQIRFPKGQISATFEEIRRVLEREGVIKT